MEPQPLGIDDDIELLVDCLTVLLGGVKAAKKAQRTSHT